MDSPNLLALIQLALTNWPAFLVICVLLLFSSGGIITLIKTLGASRRGIKGDALVKEKNSIDGFIGLTGIQENTITRQENTIATQAARIDAQDKRLDELDGKLNAALDQISDLSDAYRKEIDYSNSLEADRLAKGLAPMSRPYVIKIVTPVVQ